jgi:hypothetical protein
MFDHLAHDLVRLDGVIVNFTEFGNSYLKLSVKFAEGFV